MKNRFWTSEIKFHFKSKHRFISALTSVSVISGNWAQHNCWFSFFKEISIEGGRKEIELGLAIFFPVWHVLSLSVRFSLFIAQSCEGHLLMTSFQTESEGTCQLPLPKVLFSRNILIFSMVQRTFHTLTCRLPLFSPLRCHFTMQVNVFLWYWEPWTN